MIIRRAQERDMGGINELLSQVELVHNGIRPDLFRHGGRKYTDEELVQLISDDERPIFVAEEDGGVQGYAFCIFQRHKGDNILNDITTLYIDDLCVNENCRGRHIGRSLYEHVLSFARQNGCYNLTLNVWEGNDSARAFYDRQGLKPQKTTLEKIL